MPLSALYPASYTLYRKSGYELAGSWFKTTWQTRALKPARHGLQIRRLSEDDRDATAAVYKTSAASYNGYLDRQAYIWDRVFNVKGEPTTGYGFFSGDSMEGYVYQRQDKLAAGGSELYITDMASTTPASAQAVLTHMWSHSSMIREATSFCGSDHALLALVPEEAYALNLRFHWMLRIVHIQKALALRGYPPVSRELHLDIEDAVLPEQSGKVVLRLDEGKASVRTGGNGDLVTDIRGLAQLYSGFIPPRALSQTGGISATTTALETAELFFSGSPPGMADMF